MTNEQRDAILTLLRDNERLWTENAALKLMFENIRTEDDAIDQARHWKENLLELMNSDARKIAYAKFEDSIRAIEQAKEDQETLEMLLKLPTQGLPN